MNGPNVLQGAWGVAVSGGTLNAASTIINNFITGTREPNSLFTTSIKMSVAEATPGHDNGKPSCPAMSEDGKEGTVPIPEMKAGAFYIYYRLYTKDGPLESNQPIYSNDRSISRISSSFVRPPHTAALLKKYLCKIEGLGGFENTTLYQSLWEQTALENSTRLSFRGTPGPGLSDLNPIALVVEEYTTENRSRGAGRRSAVDSPKLVEWEYEQHYVYYRLYDDEGGAMSKTSFDMNNPFLGRVNTRSIPPPHIVSSLKNHLISSEEIPGHNIHLFKDENSESPMEDSDVITLHDTTFPGFMEDRPIAIAYELRGNTGPVGDEDPKEILARDLHEARSALAQLKKESQETNENLRPQWFLPNTSTELACWSFNGTLDDISFNQLGPAVIIHSNVGLAFEDAPCGKLKRGYIKIRNPGYLNIPSVNIQSLSFTFAFSLRLAMASTATQILLSNWSSGQWQFISTVDAAGTLSGSLRRNMQTNGSDPEQGLVDVTTAKPVPVGTWFDVTFSYIAPTRTYSVYIDQQESASSIVRPSVTDLTLHKSNVKYFQFGNKADDGPHTGNLSADLRNLRFFQINP